MYNWHISSCEAVKFCFFSPMYYERDVSVLYVQAILSVYACVYDCMQVFRPENKIISVQVTALYESPPHSFYLPPIFLSTKWTFFFWQSPHTDVFTQLSPISFDLITATCSQLPAIVSKTTTSTNTVLTGQTGEMQKTHGNKKHT